jgi:hypothetical protein
MLCIKENTKQFNIYETVEDKTIMQVCTRTALFHFALRIRTAMKIVFACVSSPRAKLLTYRIKYS